MNLFILIAIVFGLVYVIVEILKAELVHQQELQNQKSKAEKDEL